MKQLLIAFLSVFVLAVHVYANKKVLDFSGSITYLNDESRSITVTNQGNREITFFVAGTIVRGEREIRLSDLANGCTVLVSYQKNKRRYIASRVALIGCQQGGE